ncbi:MAG: zincin-like metallopeptidase domain-containing protein [Saprospiraceae bacterium]|jgi:antirestriction protein ArdC|nr:zincin-like metallopeptidase domain-containing protein [Saprospiraceae bacterium]
MKSTDKFQEMTARIITQLESGVVPWRKTWNRIQMGAPCNHFSGHIYTGINAFILSDFDVPRFATFKQASDAGHRIRKGAKSLPVYFWKMLFFDANGKRVDTRKEAEKVVPFVYEYRVFNVLDIEDFTVDMFKDEQPEPPARILVCRQAWDVCEAVLTANPHELRPGEPAYNPTLDVVKMPALTDFQSKKHYYLTYFHELSHWTGHPNRLNRIEPSKFGDERYSREELVAEMSACFLCAHCGIVMEELVENSAAYLQSWIATLNGDARLLMTAASAAQRAADFLLAPLGMQQESPQPDTVEQTESTA